MGAVDDTARRLIARQRRYLIALLVLHALELVVDVAPYAWRWLR